jgi:transcriptional regulator of aromatic amino acid metabolism
MNPLEKFEEFVISEGYNKEDVKHLLNVFLQKTIPELKEISKDIKPLRDILKILKKNPSYIFDIVDYVWPVEEEK